MAGKLSLVVIALVGLIGCEGVLPDETPTPTVAEWDCYVDGEQIDCCELYGVCQ